MLKVEKHIVYFFLLLLLISSCGKKENISITQVSQEPAAQSAFDSFLNLLKEANDSSDIQIHKQFNATNKLLSTEGKLLLYRKMGEYYYDNEIPDSALIYFNVGLELAKRVENKYYTSVFHMMNGSVYILISDFEPALSELKTSYNIAQGLDSLRLLIRSSRNLGNVYWHTGNYDLALEYYLKSLEISQKANNEFGVAAALNNIGNVYLEINNFDRALDYLKLSVALSEKNNYTKVLALANNNIGNIFLKMEKSDSALIFFQAALVNSKAINSRYDEGIYIGNIADVYMRIDSLEKSRVYFLESLECANETGDKTGLASGNLGLADLDLREKKFDLALFHLNIGTEIAEEIGSLKLLDYAYSLNSKYYLIKENFPQSHHFLSKQMTVKDSLYSYENGQNVARLENQYKEVKSIKEIELLKEKQKSFLYMAILGFSAFITISLLIFFAYRQKVRSNKVLSEKNLQIEKNRGILEEKNQLLLKSEKLLHIANKSKDDFLTIISHDLRNPLSSIRGFTELLVQNYDSLSEEQRKSFLHEVFDSIERISLLITNILFWAKSQTDGISIKNESFSLKKRLEDNISIYRLILANKDITVKNLIPENVKVLSDLNVFDMITRNILSNSIKFTESKGLITINCEVITGKVKIIISDTGVGISKDRLENILNGNEQFSTTGTRHEQGTGLGLGLSFKFIELIGGEFDINSEPGKGTNISFTLNAIS